MPAMKEAASASLASKRIAGDRCVAEAEGTRLNTVHKRLRDHRRHVPKTV